MYSYWNTSLREWLPNGARGLSFGCAHGPSDAMGFDRYAGYAYGQVDHLFLAIGYGQASSFSRIAGFFGLFVLIQNPL
jgi:hypothetical protein